jgi:quercetin dioxygenase-like cupin family protein
MIHSTRATRATSSVILLFVLSTYTTLAQDPMKVAPHIFRLLFENDRVRVLQEWLRPGEREPMHSHPKVVVYALNSFKGESTSLSGRVTAFEADAGDVNWSEAETHTLQNTGKREIHAIIVELKTPQNLPSTRGEGGPDPLRVASRTHKLLLENNLVRVLGFHLTPGQRTRTHYQRDGVLYVLNGGVLKESFPDGKIVRQVFRPRQARWVEAKSHALENIGTTEVRFFMVELKSPPEEKK